MAGDGGSWLRQQCLIMAQNSHTAVPYWLSLPLVELAAWIEDNNRIAAETPKQKKR